MTRLLILFSVVTVAAVAAVVVLPGDADAADLYVAPQGGGSTCSAAVPCGTLDAAYRASKPGDVVEVGGGTYGTQTVPALGRPAPAVEFRPAQGATVVVNGLNIRADHVVVRGVRSSDFLDVDSGNAADYVDDVRLVDVQTASHWINGARDFVWQGGSIGPSFNVKASMVGGQPASERLTYDRVLWHDATRDSQAVHMECFYVASVQGLTIRNSRFHNCAVFDVLITQLGTDAQPRDIVFENTIFEGPKDVGGAPAYYSFMVHENVALNSFVLRNNLWELPFAINGSVATGRAVGNIGVAEQVGACRDGFTYSHNIFTKGRCGPTDKVVANAFSQFVDRAAGDWRLKAGAAAIDAGDPGEYPQLDAIGNARPFGAGPDAGPYEFGSAPPGGQGDNTSQPLGAAATRRKARVLKVIDGRTLRVRFNGGPRARVRLLGIRLPARRCGGVGAARLRALAPPGKSVTVITDPRAKARDAHGRRLAYVSRSRRDVGRRLIANGWARLANGSAGISRRATYEAAQRRAKQRHAGLWGCG